MRIANTYVVLTLALAGVPAGGQVPAATDVSVAPALNYADIVGFAEAAPIVASVMIADATRLSPEQSGGVAAGFARFYVEADVLALIRGASGGLPTRVRFLMDAPLDARGKAPKLRKARKLLFARGAAGKPDELQLLSPAAQVDWSQADEDRLRAVVAALLAPDAPPRVTGVGNAFHVPGSLPGESETQIFLQTADRRPVSLTILRRPGEEPRWAVALSEIVDQAAEPPARDTLLWYRLACGLPPSLPDTSVSSLDPAGARAARQDYRFVLDSLGTCGRSVSL